eukprot:SAG25_NODE_10115_length_345_cov_1.032520_1_plen_43_part_10
MCGGRLRCCCGSRSWFMVLLLGPVAAVPNGLGQTPANGALTSG